MENAILQLAQQFKGKLEGAAAYYIRTIRWKSKIYFYYLKVYLRQAIAIIMQETTALGDVFQAIQDFCREPYLSFLLRYKTI